MDNSADNSVVDPEKTEAVSSEETSSSPPSPAMEPTSTSRWTAYLQILAGHLMIFDTFGYIGSWGLFQSYYISTLGRSQSDISWIGSIQLLLVFFVGTFSGRSLDAGYLRITLAIGICVGLGDGLIFCPMISLISTYYDDKNRALAVSFAAAGAATGGMVFPAIAKQLLPRLGEPWSVRVMGFVFVFNSAITLLVVKPRVAARKSGPLVEWTAFKELPYSLYAIGIFLTLWGLYFAYYYISVFGSHVIHVPPDQSFYLIIAINGIGIPGRIFPAWFAARVIGNALHVLIPLTFGAGVLLYFWRLVHSYSGLLAWIIVYGFFANAVQSLFVGSVGSLTKDRQKMGVRVGMIFTIVSFACLTGPPIAGALIDLRGGDFLYAQIFGGTAVVLGSCVLTAAAIVSNRETILDAKE
ncbi:major facilitator superfamily domain-containing protein [Trichoderma breve]|uniref:Major facilitator superfamily domain-containing protein n=1 Tax=Trichoderma breve TaxID=2034170 RepID=A0A9W9JS55_9HYPO|nr:major facilitator superfamily domain-containing protein [Trichoderma breve]KAJ4865589.1 major facilitator superfamily domain-containing protein [Trichoderma breve]